MSAMGLYSEHRNHPWVKHLRNALIALLLTFLAALALFPIFYMITSSFGPAIATAGNMRSIFPSSWSLDSYRAFFNFNVYAKRWILNSFIISLSTVIGNVIFASMAGYAFAKLDFPLKNPLFFIILTQLMLPGQVFIIPQYLMLSSMNQLNTRFALIFPGLVSAFGTFFLRQFYMSLPNDLAEAARLDGCNVMQTFVWVMAPLTKTAVMALAVFTALFAYSDMMWPLIVNMNIDKMTLAAGISSLQGQHSTNYPVMMAGSALAMIPMLAIYLIFQKQFIEGIALTGTKA